MKKKFLPLFIAMLCTVCLCAFTGCNSGKVVKTEIDEKTCYVFTEKSENFQAGATVADYLKTLKEKGELNYDDYDGEYGLYITAVDGLKEEFSADFTSGKYWSLYLDFTESEGVIYASDNNICEYNGKTYYYANYGFSGIPCLDGHSYILAYVPYGN